MLVEHPYPLFRRLAFFAATNVRLLAPPQALDWLLADEHWWLWSVETKREALRLLVTVAPLLDAEGKQALERAILQGPPRTMFNDEIEPERLQRTFDRQIWLRLVKCTAAGAELGADATSRLEALSHQYPAWCLAKDERDEFPFWMGGDEEWREFLPTPKTCRQLVAWLHQHPTADTLKRDDWRSLQA